MHRIVFLQRGTLNAHVRRPAFAHEWAEHTETSAAEQAARLSGASIAISNKLAMPRSLLEQLPELKLIAISATGANHIDLACCRERGIAVCNVRGYSRHTLPEHTMMLLLALSRSLPAYLRDVAAGAWQQSDKFFLDGAPIADLHGATLGIIGRGSAGDAVARLATAFGMKVLFAEHRRASGVREGYAAFDTVLRSADAITLHCPLTAETDKLMGVRELALMKPGALLINTARGGLIDEAALLAALESGHLGGAGLDVLSEEPPVRGNPL
ncbi:MAG: NAD(P)-dependent oxidoreductase, partial [Hyphomicrobium sp.]|nr:NAD(P)-dependent oxidoreductase [Hyphomicrobium sp.]